MNHQSPPVNFTQALLQGQAHDKGLYFPEKIPRLSTHFIKQLTDYTQSEIAFQIIQPYIEKDTSTEILKTIIKKNLTFYFPLVPVTFHIASLELFHGPTLAFKDIDARFISRRLGYFNRNNNRVTTVLVATPGETGSAVSNRFLGIQSVEVVILYPSQKVSPIQELQLTTCGQNITALEIQETFDDCQAMIKDIFTDKEIYQKLSLTSANSINVTRWLPQQFYYFFALQRWESEEPPIISVPSGNFGNICAGLLFYKSELPIRHLIAACACNANNTIPHFLQTGQYEPKLSISTLSNAMDVGDPKNFIRILEMFNNQLVALKQSFSSMSVSDYITLTTIHKVYKETRHLLDPHGAVAFHALETYLTRHPKEKGIFLETAYPAKLPKVTENAIGKPIALSQSVQNLLKKEKKRTRIAPIHPIKGMANEPITILYKLKSF